MKFIKDHGYRGRILTHRQVVSILSYGRFYLSEYVPTLTKNVAIANMAHVPRLLQARSIPTEYMPLSLYGVHEGWLVPFVQMFDRRLLCEYEEVKRRKEELPSAYKLAIEPFLINVIKNEAMFSQFLAHYFYLCAKVFYKLSNIVSWSNVFRLSMTVFALLIQTCDDREGERNLRHLFIYHGSTFTQYIDERLGDDELPIFASLQIFVLNILEYDLEISKWQAQSVWYE